MIKIYLSVIYELGNNESWYRDIK